MELWIPLTIAAAFFQNIRSAMQKHLKGKLSTLGASYVRFVYAWPIALVYLFAVIVIEGQPLTGLQFQLSALRAVRRHLSDHVHDLPAVVVFIS